MGLKARWWSVVVLAGAVVLAGCGDDSDTTTTGATSGGGSPTTSAATDSGGGYYGGTPTTAAAPTTSVAAASGVVKVAQTSLGSVLVDDKGRTLYVFLRDEKNKSNCTGGCLNTWPPYTVTAVSGGAGIDASLLGSIDTADGKKQLTISGAPLYYFSGDTAAGDTKGQGVGGNWYVVDAKGAAIK